MSFHHIQSHLLADSIPGLYAAAFEDSIRTASVIRQYLDSHASLGLSTDDLVTVMREYKTATQVAAKMIAHGSATLPLHPQTHLRWAHDWGCSVHAIEYVIQKIADNLSIGAY